MMYSYRTKIALYTMATTLFALFLSALGFMILFNYSMREGVASELRNMASQLGAASIPAIQFKDDITAAELVDYRGLSDQILEATLFDQERNVFARYVREDTSARAFPVEPFGEVHFGDSFAYVAQPVQSGGQTIGYLQIYRDLSSFQARLFIIGWMVAAILMGILVLTLITSTWLNRMIRKPMRELALTASKVGKSSGGYSVRAQKHAEDELGTLTDVFNNMLDRIQDHERDLRHSHARLRQVIDLVPHMIFAKDRQGRIILVNKTMAQALGTTVENMLDSRTTQWFPRESLEAMKQSDEEVLETGRPQFSDETFVNSNGEVINLHTTKIPYVQSGSSENAILGISIDVTRAKQAERDLQNSRDELDRRVQEKTSELVQARAHMGRQEKLALMGRISGNIAHELRNPLGAVRQSAYLIEMVLEQLDLDPQNEQLMQKHLEMIVSEVEASNDVISNLLGSTRVQKQSQKEKVDLVQVLELSHSRVWVEEWGRLHVQVPEEGVCVLGDSLQLRQVFVNLLDNAKAAVANMEEAAVWIHVEPEGECATVQITDNGHGMSEETRSRLFEPLYTTNPQGSGLGLSICREIVEDRHGGTIEFESTEGVGTQVEVTLPLYRPEQNVQETQSPPLTAAAPEEVD